MKKFIAKNIGYPFQDLVKGTNILKTYEFLLETQKWDISKLKAYQLDKLIRIIDHSYNNIPYYRDLFNSINLKPNDIKSFDDMHKIPILTKQIARENYQKLLWPNRNKLKLKTGKTGGTTGVPLNIIKDTQTRSFTWGSYYRWYNWIGIEIGDPVLTLWGSPTVLNQPTKQIIKSKIGQLISNNLKVNSFKMNQSNLHSILNEINDFKPKLIKGYLSALLQFADFIEEGGGIIQFQPTAISSTTETLLKPYKEYLERVFNAKMYDQYGCGECGGIAYECGSQQGLHITMEHVYIEILNPDNTNAQFNKGKLILTDLDNYAMPFIRYQNGDIARVSEKKCKCGIEHTLLDSIEGRSADTIILKDGSQVHGVFFTDILYELKSTEGKKMIRFQVYQNESGKIDFRIESEQPLNNDFLTELHFATLRFFNEVKISVVGKLNNEANGKFRYIISDLPKSNSL